jgi:biotin transporter BioY
MARSGRDARRQDDIEQAKLDRAERISRLQLSMSLVGAIALILVPTIYLDESSRLFVLKLVSAGLLAFLPGWLYLQFIRNKGRSLYDEYVLNLFRLHIDKPANLPAPPKHTTYYLPWSKAHEKLRTKSKDNLYRTKFEAVYGRSSVSTLRLIVEKGKPPKRTEAFSPVVYATLILCLGWVLVLQPELLGALRLGEIVPSGKPLLPVEPLQFGFLGAYTFIIQDLVRRYYRDDLRTSGYIAAISRIVFSAVLIMTVNLMWTDQASQQENILAFFIGFFPQIGLQVLKTALTAPLGKLVPSLSTEYPLSSLEGVNFWYEARLNEEGIEDQQNLVSASLVDLMLKTRAPVMRLVDWLDQSFLQLHLPTDPKNLKSMTMDLRRLGIRTATEFENTFEELGRDPVFQAALGSALGVTSDESPIVARSIVVALHGEVNYWHVRQFRRHSWLKAPRRVPVATPADIGAHPELADTTEIDLTAESNGEAIVDRETITD